MRHDEQSKPHPDGPQPMAGSRLRTVVLPAAWFTMSAVWAVIIVVTDHLAWPLALWIATTVGPLTALERHREVSR